MFNFSRFIIILISVFINGCSFQQSSFTDMKCLEHVGMFYYTNEVSIDSIYKSCPIELSDKRYYFSRIINGGKSKTEALSANTKSACMDKWDAMISRAWSVSQEEIDNNKSLKANASQSEMILSSIFEGNLSTEALNEYIAQGNKERDSSQCLSVYDPVNIARELAIVKLLSFDPAVYTNETSLTNVELWAAWRIILHADIHQDVQEHFEPIFTKIAQSKRFSGHSVALLSDRISMSKMEPLKYGVLYECVDGKISHTLDDIESVNAKRKAIHMEPYEDWLTKEKLKARCK